MKPKALGWLTLQSCAGDEMTVSFQSVLSPSAEVLHRKKKDEMFIAVSIMLLSAAEAFYTKTMKEWGCKKPGRVMVMVFVENE